VFPLLPPLLLPLPPVAPLPPSADPLPKAVPLALALPLDVPSIPASIEDTGLSLLPHIVSGISANGRTAKASPFFITSL
jgi:hypothetical protein